MEILLILLCSYILFSIMFWTIKVGISPMFSSTKATTFLVEKSKQFSQNTIVDLGSGFGTLAYSLAKANPNKQIIGYELSPLPYYFSFIFTLFAKNLTFKRKDFLEIEYSKDNLYICYLFPKGIEKLQNKIQKDKLDIQLISSTFAFSNIKYKEKYHLNDIYKTPIYIY